MADAVLANFSLGIDQRQPRTSGAVRLWDALNVLVRPGGTLTRRPPTRLGDGVDRSIIGLARAGGKFHGWFAGTAPASGTYPSAATFELHDVTYGTRALAAVLFAEIIAGKLYHVVRYADGTVQHWYDTDRVTDQNCPHSPFVAVVGRRVFATDGEVVRFSKVADPTDWSGTDDAGFLPTGRESGGQSDPTALHEWRSKLLVFFAGQIQVWTVGLDPVRQHARDDTIQATGTKNAGSLAGTGDAVIYRAPEGYRMVRADAFGRPVSVAIGKPIDQIVLDPARPEIEEQRAVFAPALSAYINIRSSRSADVLCYAPESRLRAWVFWTFESPIDYPVVDGEDVLFRNLESGRIVSMSAAARRQQEYRDEVGPAIRSTFPTETVVQAARAFPLRAGSNPTAYSGGSTPRANSGPSLQTNTAAFVSFPIPSRSTGRDGILLFATGLLAPRGFRETLRLDLEYLAQGAFSAMRGGWIETSETMEGENWRTRAFLAGWGYDAARRKGDRVVDVAGRGFYVAEDGGWRRSGQIVIEREVRRVRLRLADGSALGAYETGQPWAARDLGLDYALPYVASRFEIPARLPTNLAPQIVFLALSASPGFYIPAGADVARKVAGTATGAALVSTAHRLAFGGSWGAPPATWGVRRLAPVTTAGDLQYTVGSDGFRPAGDLDFTPAPGSKWYETLAVSLSAWVDTQASPEELLIVSSNGRLYNPSSRRGRLTVVRYGHASGGTKLGTLAFDFPAMDTYHADVGVFYLTADLRQTSSRKWYLIDVAAAKVHVYARGASNAAQPVYESTFDLPAGIGLVVGAAARDGSLYIATFPDRRIYRHRFDAGAWVIWTADVSQDLQTMGEAHFRAGGKGENDNILSFYDWRARRLRGWTVATLSEVGATATAGEFCLRSIEVTVGDARSYECFARCTYISPAPQAALKEWKGVRFEQIGVGEFRHAYQVGGVDQLTSWATVEGDTIAAPQESIGVMAPELAAEFRVRHDGPWEFSGAHYTVRSRGSWA